MATADDEEARLAPTHDAFLSRWRSLDRGWQATALGVALVAGVHLVA